MSHSPTGGAEVEVLAQRDGVQQDRHVEPLDRRQELVAVGIRQRPPSPEHVADRARLQTELGHRALELGGGELEVLHRQLRRA